MSRLLPVGVAVVGLLAAARPAAAQEPQLVVRQLTFEGNRAIDNPTLAASIATTNSSWFARAWPLRYFGLGEKRYFDETDFQRDVLRLEVLYKRSGFPDAKVDTLVRREPPRNVYITFIIHEGAPIRITKLEWRGIDSLQPDDRKDLFVDLPIHEGDPFNRFALQTAIDTVNTRLHDRGYPLADAFRQFTADAKTKTAEVQVDVQPGKRMGIGAIRVEGSTRVDSSLARKLLVTRTRRRFRAGELVESQRNLYAADLYAYVSVGVDSAHFDPAGDSVPLLVRVSDAPPRRVRGAAGFGTNDCFRASSGLTLRDFFGGGRIFDLSGRVSKIGVGDPFDFGLDKTICAVSRRDTVGSAKFNYSVSASVRRPAFLSPLNTISLSPYAERRSEYKVYLREEVGARIGFTHSTPRRRLPLALAYTMAYGRTTATPASFCTFFSACTPGLIQLQQERRRLATLTGTMSIPRANNPIDPTRGYVVSLEATHSSPLTFSSRQLEFTRFVADAAWYRTLTRNVVLSWHLRGGIIVAPNFRATGTVDSKYVPLEQRFYGGGPNDVRGYQRNELGPVVYVVPQPAIDSFGVDSLPPDRVRVAATGGNALAVGNIELRVPSPVFSNRLRLAAFVDAGSVWERNAPGSRAVLRMTPGIGLRLATPLGPARLDVAYNPNALEAGPLFATDTTGTLTAVPGQTSYIRRRTSKLTFHFSVGQAF